MVSLKNLVTPLFVIPKFSQRPFTNRNILNPYRVNSLENIPGFSFFFKKNLKTENVQDLAVNSINLLSESQESSSYKDSTYEDRFSKIISQLEPYNKEKFLDSFLKIWVEKKIKPSTYNLMALKDILDCLDLNNETVSKILDSHYQKSEERDTLDGLLLLMDIFAPEDPYTSFKERAYHKLYQENQIDYKNVLYNLKINLVNNEYKKYLEDQFNIYKLENLCPSRVENPTPLFFKFYKNRLFDTFKIYKSKFSRIKKPDLNKILSFMPSVFWHIDFYQKEVEFIVPESLEILRLERETLESCFRKLVNTRVQDIIRETVDKFLKPKAKVHRLNFPRVLLEEELRYSKEALSHWYKYQKHKIQELSLYAESTSSNPLDFDKYELVPKGFTVIGLDRPYVNIELLGKDEDAFYLNFDRTRKVTLEQVKFARENLRKKSKYLIDLKKEFDFYSDLTPEQLSHLFLDKFKHECNYAMKARDRRNLLQKLGNPFNTDLEIPSIPESPLKQQDDYGLKLLNPTEITDDVLSNYKSDVLTQYLYHTMNINHLLWQLRYVKTNPIEYIVAVSKNSRDITIAKPKRIKFPAGKFEMALKDLESFKKTKNSEADKLRSQWLNQVEEVEDLEELESREFDEGPLFQDDQDFIYRDLNLYRDMLKDGLSLKIESNIPEKYTNNRESALSEDTRFKKMTISQPTPIYKCTKCDYRIFGHFLQRTNGSLFRGSEIYEFRNDKDYKCRNCNADRSSFVVTWTTGEKGYDVPPWFRKDHFDPNS